jgi:hypothetical protein
MPTGKRRYVSDLVILRCGHTGTKDGCITPSRGEPVYLCTTCEDWQEEQPAVPVPKVSRARVEVPNQGMLF